MQPKAVLKTETFNRDPGWEAFNNRMKPDPKDLRTVVQDFGYSQTNFAGGDKERWEDRFSVLQPRPSMPIRFP